MTSLFEPRGHNLTETLARLGPYLRGLLERGAERALWLHADEVHVEHVLGAAIGDENSAAGQVVEHAFADPETLDTELLALSPGLMVVGAKAVLPFSWDAVTALRSARARALEEGCSPLSTTHIAEACAAALPQQARELLAEPTWRPGPGDADDAVQLDPEGHLFQGFTTQAKRCLVRACRSASGAGERGITPHRLLLAALEEDGDLRASCGWSPTQVRSAIRQNSPQESSPPRRLIPPSTPLALLLGRLPKNADSLDLLGASLSGVGEELAACFGRHRITLELIERARSAFRDPPGPAPESVC